MSTKPNAESEISANENSNDDTAARRKGSFYPAWLAFPLAAALIVAIFCLRTFDEQVSTAFPIIEPAIINIITLIVGFLAFDSLLLWFLLHRQIPSRVRWTVGIGLFVAIAAAFAAIRIDGVAGDLTPRFAWRWSPPIDADLTPLETPAAVAADGVDLTQTTPDDFPQFLGPDRMPYLPETELVRDWAAHPPKLIWKQPIGAGLSGFSVVQNYAFTLEQRGEDEWVTCYEVETGKPVWGHSIVARYESKLGGIGPRSTPTIHEGRVYALGATGVLRCLDAATGKLLWQDDIVKRVGLTEKEDLEMIAFGRSGSPLIVDNLVVVPAGGKKGKTHSLIAYDKQTGKVAWMKGDKQISYASPALATIAGRRQILTVNEDTVAGHDAETGDELWTFPWPGASNGNASCSQAVPLGDDQVLISKGYGIGSAVYKISVDSAGKWSAKPVWENRRVLKTKFTNVAVIDGYAYGLSEGVLECVEAASGKSEWKKGRYRNGQLLGVGKSLLVISESGELILVDATPEESRELGKLQAIEGQTWNTLCLSGNRLLVRNSEEAACYELSLAGDK